MAQKVAFFRTSPARIYGPPPLFAKISERLWLASGFVLIAGLALAAIGFHPGIALTCSLFSFFVFFPPILPLSYVRRKANIIPFVLAILILRPDERAFPLIIITISTVYLSAGWEKALRSGLRWTDGRSLQYHLMNSYLYYDQPSTLWVAERLWLCKLLSMWVLAFELSFPLVVFFPGLGVPYAIAGTLFHVGIWRLMRINYLVYFWPAYFVFFV